MTDIYKLAARLRHAAKYKLVEREISADNELSIEDAEAIARALPLYRDLADLLRSSATREELVIRAAAADAALCTLCDPQPPQPIYHTDASGERWARPGGEP
jgi:hypothetical protein